MSVKQPKQLSVCFLPLSSACSSPQAVSWRPPPAHQHTAVCRSLDPSKIRCRSGTDANWIRQQGPKGQAGRPLIASRWHASFTQQSDGSRQMSACCSPGKVACRHHLTVRSRTVTDAQTSAGHTACGWQIWGQTLANCCAVKLVCRRHPLVDPRADTDLLLCLC